MRSVDEQAARASRYGLKVLTRPGEGLGFRLAGIAVEEVAEGAEAERVARLLREPGLGVLAVEQRVLERVTETVRARARRAGLPMLLPFSLPRAWGEVRPAEAYIGELIRRAIGHHVRLVR